MKDYYPISEQVCNCFLRSDEAKEIWEKFKAEWDGGTDLRGMEKLGAAYNAYLDAIYGVPVMLLGPEEGGHYSTPYCLKCLRELVKELEKYENENVGDKHL